MMVLLLLTIRTDLLSLYYLSMRLFNILSTISAQLSSPMLRYVEYSNVVYKVRWTILTKCDQIDFVGKSCRKLNRLTFIRFILNFSYISSFGLFRSILGKETERFRTSHIEKQEDVANSRLSTYFATMRSPSIRFNQDEVPLLSRWVSMFSFFFFEGMRVTL